MFILFNQMFCSRTNVLSKARGCSDPPEPPGPHGSTQAVASFGSSPGPSLLKSQKYFPWNLKRSSKLFHRYRQGDLIMIKQVIMPILVMEETGMTRRDNRPYYQKNSTDDCLTTVKLAAKLRNTER